MAAGRHLYSSDDELDALFAPDQVRAAELLPLVECTVIPECRYAVSAALDAARRVAQGEALEDAELAAVGASLTDEDVRNALISAISSGELPDSDALWLLLARNLVDGWRAQALALVAAAAFKYGDNLLALVAMTNVAEDLADAYDFLSILSEDDDPSQ